MIDPLLGWGDNMCSGVVHRMQKQHHANEKTAQTKDFTMRLLELRHLGSLDLDLVPRHRFAAWAEALSLLFSIKGTVLYLFYMGRLHTNVKLSNRLEEPPAEGTTVDCPDGCLHDLKRLKSLLQVMWNLKKAENPKANNLFENVPWVNGEFYSVEWIFGVYLFVFPSYLPLL